MTTSAFTSTSNKLQERQLISIPPLDPKKFQNLIPNRFDTLHLHDESPSNNRTDYRYRLIVMDRSLPPKTSTSISRSQYLQGITHPVAVFLIPAGREAEYLFRTYRGLNDIAKSANCARLIAVSFHRDHVYQGGQKVVQAELEVAVQTIAQQGAFMYVDSKEREWYLQKLRKESANSVSNTSFSIPFMALDGIGKRDVIVEGDSPTTGPFLVEEVDVDGGRTVRRLYFRENENVVQTEVFLKKDHRARARAGTGVDGTVIDMLKLAFDYHQHIAAGALVLGGIISPSISKQDDGSPPEHESCGQGMVIGLGGGALVNFFMEFMPSLNLTVVELDKSIVDIAKSHFGFRADSLRVKVVIGDGLTICAKNSIGSMEGEKEEKFGHEENVADVAKDREEIVFAPNSMQFIVIDVDSKDTSIGMSCPPVPFVSPTYLSQLYELLGEDGVLVINVSARDPTMLHSVKTNVHQIFDSVFVSNTDTKTIDEDVGNVAEDLNVVVFCTKNKDHVIDPDLDHYSTLLRNLCTANNVAGEEVISELEDCIAGIKKVNVTMKKESDDSLNQGGKTSSKPSKSSRGKKKGNSKKKKGKKK